MIVLLELSVVPLGREGSVAPWVARCVDIIDRSGLEYQLHAMGTNIEGPLDRVLDVMRQCIEAVAADCDRVSCSAKIDYRKEMTGRIASKVESVEAVLGRQVDTEHESD
jgi:uncharacterized protein (TIGR00106 family)